MTQLQCFIDKQLNKNKEKIRYTNTDIIKEKQMTYIQTTDILTRLHLFDS